MIVKVASDLTAKVSTPLQVLPLCKPGDKKEGVERGRDEFDTNQKINAQRQRLAAAY